MNKKIDNVNKLSTGNLQGDNQTSIDPQFKKKLTQLLDKTSLTNKEGLIKKVNSFTGNKVECLHIIFKALDQAGYSFDDSLYGVWNELQFANAKTLKNSYLVDTSNQISKIWNPNFEFNISNKIVSLIEKPLEAEITSYFGAGNNLVDPITTNSLLSSMLNNSDSALSLITSSSLFNPMLNNNPLSLMPDANLLNPMQNNSLLSLLLDNSFFNSMANYLNPLNQLAVANLTYLPPLIINTWDPLNHNQQLILKLNSKFNWIRNQANLAMEAVYLLSLFDEQKQFNDKTLLDHINGLANINDAALHELLKGSGICLEVIDNLLSQIIIPEEQSLHVQAPVDSFASYVTKTLSNLPKDRNLTHYITKLQHVNEDWNSLNSNQNLITKLSAAINSFRTSNNLSPEAANVIDIFDEVTQFNDLALLILSSNTPIVPIKHKVKFSQALKIINTFLKNIDNRLNPQTIPDDQSIQVSVNQFATDATDTRNPTNRIMPFAPNTARKLNDETGQLNKKIHSSSHHVNLPIQEGTLQNDNDSKVKKTIVLIEENIKLITSLKEKMSKIVNNVELAKKIRFHYAKYGDSATINPKEIEGLNVRIINEYESNYEARNLYRQGHNQMSDDDFYKNVSTSNMTIKTLSAEVKTLVKGINQLKGNQSPQLSLDTPPPDTQEIVTAPPDITIELTQEEQAKIQQKKLSFYTQHHKINNMPVNEINTPNNFLTSNNLTLQPEITEEDNSTPGKDSQFTEIAQPVVQGPSTQTIVKIKKLTNLPPKVMDDIIDQVAADMYKKAAQLEPLKLENFFIVGQIRTGKGKDSKLYKLIKKALKDFGNKDEINIQYQIALCPSKIEDHLLRQINESLFLNVQNRLTNEKSTLAKSQFMICNKRITEKVPYFKSYLIMLREVMLSCKLNRRITASGIKITSDPYEALNKVNTKVISEKLTEFPIITLQCLMKLKEDYSNYLYGTVDTICKNPPKKNRK